jgi:hypothetical protein
MRNGFNGWLQVQTAAERRIDVRPVFIFRARSGESG